MPRYNKVQRDGIAAIRANCADILSEVPQFPEVVGDRKLIRFLLGHNEDVAKATEMFRKFLLWRKEHGVDTIRNNIVSGGMDHPTKFPNAEVILKLMPCLAIAHEACDRTGSPICVDQYDFEPSEVLEKIGVANYHLFFIHILEYKSLILEQLGEERDQAYLASLPDDEARAMAEYIPPYIDDGNGNLDPVQPESAPWGNIVATLVVRDLAAVGFRHLGPTGQEIIRGVVTMSSDNYPELLRKCLIVNAPWVFSSIWYLISGWVAPKTVAKVSILGSSFMEELRSEIAEENIPVMIGGSCNINSSLVYESYPFNKEYFVDPHYVSQEEADRRSAAALVASHDAGTSGEGACSPLPPGE